MIITQRKYRKSEIEGKDAILYRGVMERLSGKVTFERSLKCETRTRRHHFPRKDAAHGQDSGDLGGQFGDWEGWGSSEAAGHQRTKK